MIPTNAISPLTATAAAVPIVAAATTINRTRGTSTPSVAASSSPTLSTSSTRRCRTSTTELTTMYGSATSTSFHVAVVKPPSSQVYTLTSVSLCCCCTNVCTAVMNVATITPARTSAPVARARPAERPSTYVRTTEIVAPPNAAGGSSCDEPDPYAITSVAPRPAPAATPSRYGSASGLRDTPWYDAPA